MPFKWFLWRPWVGLTCLPNKACRVRFPASLWMSGFQLTRFLPRPFKQKRAGHRFHDGPLAFVLCVSNRVFGNQFKSQALYFLHIPEPQYPSSQSQSIAHA